MGKFCSVWLKSDADLLCSVIYSQKTMKNMTIQVGNHRVGAAISALVHFIHQSQHIKNKFLNQIAGQHLKNCITLQQEVKQVSRKEQLCLVVQHNDFKNNKNTFMELYSVKRFWQVQESSAPVLLFLEEVTRRLRWENKSQFQGQWMPILGESGNFANHQTTSKCGQNRQ